MNKSVSKRIRITKRGKIMRRQMGTDHFKTSKSKKSLRSKRMLRTLGVSKKTLLGY